MDGKTIDLIKEMYADMQENHQQIMDRFVAIENDMAELKTQLSKDSTTIEKDFESIQDSLIEVKYNT